MLLVSQDKDIIVDLEGKIVTLKNVPDMGTEVVVHDGNRSYTVGKYGDDNIALYEMSKIHQNWKMSGKVYQNEYEMLSNEDAKTEYEEQVIRKIEIRKDVEIRKAGRW